MGITVWGKNLLAFKLLRAMMKPKCINITLLLSLIAKSGLTVYMHSNTIGFCTTQTYFKKQTNVVFVYTNVKQAAMCHEGLMKVIKCLCTWTYLLFLKLQGFKETNGISAQLTWEYCKSESTMTTRWIYSKGVRFHLHSLPYQLDTMLTYTTSSVGSCCDHHRSNFWLLTELKISSQGTMWVNE